MFPRHGNADCSENEQHGVPAAPSLSNNDHRHDRHRPARCVPMFLATARASTEDHDHASSWHDASKTGGPGTTSPCFVCVSVGGRCLVAAEGPACSIPPEGLHSIGGMIGPQQIAIDPGGRGSPLCICPAEKGGTRHGRCQPNDGPRLLLNRPSSWIFRVSSLASIRLRCLRPPTSRFFSAIESTLQPRLP